MQRTTTVAAIALTRLERVLLQDIVEDQTAQDIKTIIGDYRAMKASLAIMNRRYDEVRLERDRLKEIVTKGVAQAEIAKDRDKRKDHIKIYAIVFSAVAAIAALTTVIAALILK